MLRFAPSPTGEMHIGNLRVALFNYMLSKQRDEDFIVRIEDMNKEKNVDGKDQEILDILALFGLEYSQVIYQSQNIRFHSAMALQLIHDKKAFSCFCSLEWLDKKKNEAKNDNTSYCYDDACRNLPAELVIDNMSPFTIRVARPDATIMIKDSIKRDVSFEPDAVDSFIIMNQDKTPTDNFASAVDDMLSDISMVIRSQEHLGNAPKQEHIRELLNYDKKVEYAHLPIILNDGDKNMSVKWLLEEGYLPSAISNYLISIGNKTPKEIFSMQEAMEWFTLENISESPTRFSLEKLKDINKKHLYNLDAIELSRYVGFADANIGELAKVYLSEVGTTKELKSKIEPIFASKEIPAEFVESAKIMTKTIKDAPYFEEYDDFKRYVIKESGLEAKNFLQTLRYLLTGAKNTPDITMIYKCLKNYIGEIIK